MLKEYAEQEYKYGFVTDIESDTLPPGLNEDVIKFISKKKDEPEWLTEWRLKAYKIWKKMEENMKEPNDEFLFTRILTIMFLIF